MADESNPASADALANMQRELASMKNALSLLGVKPCSVCGRYFLSSNAANLFIAGGEAVCYSCFPDWWPKRCTQLGVPDREGVEHKIMRWLVAHHGGKVYRDPSELPPREDKALLHVVVGCTECKGSGKLAHQRCPHCLGNGHIRVVTPK